MAVANICFRITILVIYVIVTWNGLVQSTDKVKHICHFLAVGRNSWLTAKHYKNFPYTIQVSLHENNKINLPVL
jgi:hypothetical protein